jgi:hypothetical protein
MFQKVYMPGEPSQLKRVGEAPKGFLPKEERMFLDSQRVILEQTEGWGQMTVRQQTMLLASLIVQKRAERGTDEASIARIKKFPSLTKVLDAKYSSYKPMYDNETGHLIGEPKKNYETSQDIISSMMCHQAVNFVERERIPDVKDIARQKSGFEIKREKSDIWYRYFAIQWEALGENRRDTLLQKINQIGFPAVVYFDTRTIDREYVGHPPVPIGANHSFIVLGVYKQDIIAWEKVSKNFAFRIASLDEILSGYPHITHFAVRPLENRASSSLAKRWLPKEK